MRSLQEEGVSTWVSRKALVMKEENALVPSKVQLAGIQIRERGKLKKRELL
jgi:hypothetical protein